MSAEQTIEAANARIARFEEAEKARMMTGAVAAEIGKYELAPAHADQLQQLIVPQVSLLRTNTGQDMVFGPAYKELSAHVAEVLQRPEYGHFLKQKATTAPPGQGAAPPAAPGHGRHASSEPVACGSSRRSTRRPLSSPRFRRSRAKPSGRRSCGGHRRACRRRRRRIPG